MNARVKAVLSDGLLVSFLTYFNGTIDPFHLGQARLSPSAIKSPLCTPLPGKAAAAAWRHQLHTMLRLSSLIVILIGAPMIEWIIAQVT